jgi:PiT family inorganic phosphate transporter
MSGTAVAATIGKGIVRPEAINVATVAAAMVAIVFWSTLAWYFGLPTSESHALVAGLSGAGLATAGPGVLLWDGWQKVLIGLVFSTFLGFLGGLGLTAVIYRAFWRVRPGKVRRLFGRLQLVSAAFMAFSHGSNDGQKFIGAFTLTLVLGGVLPEFQVSLWVILLCAVTMGVGTAIGGWRIVKTMGLRLTKLDPVHGFAAETAASTVLLSTAYLGYPISTTHVITSAIMGVGATERASAVKWGVSRDIFVAWIVTLPASALVGAICAWIAAAIFER